MKKAVATWNWVSLVTVIFLLAICNANLEWYHWIFIINYVVSEAMIQLSKVTP